MKEPTLIMMAGLPGSGKSTYVKELLEDNDDYFVYSTDNFIEQEAEKSNKTYNEVFKEMIKQAELLAEKNLQVAIENNMNIIWDQTNLTRKTRAKKLAKIPVHYKLECVFFSTEINTILQRNEERQKTGRQIPKNVLKSMIDSVETPMLDEGFCYVKNLYGRVIE